MRTKLIKRDWVSEILRRQRLYGNCPYALLPADEVRRREETDYSDWPWVAAVFQQSLEIFGPEIGEADL